MESMAPSIPLLSFLLLSVLLLFSFSSYADKTQPQALKQRKLCSDLEKSACSPASRAKSLLDLGSLRDSLIRLEGTIVFGLIERSKYGYKHGLYEKQLQLFLHESEAVQAKFGRYTSEEENPFSNYGLPCSELPTPANCTKVLHRPASCFNINDRIKAAYLGLLPNITTKAYDESYAAATLASDLSCLQAISQRIHYGKFVAEVKYMKNQSDYDQAISKQNKTALTDLLTDKKVEEAVVKRVEKKAMMFEQNIDLDDKSGTNQTYKVDPSVISRFYNQSVIPLTKDVEIEYLLHRA